ncbi:hypothetical protein [Nitriliruptor alkaliphilus]|uniref:hypothetical protein n=1 Tax=Nitriliruptor alkaliphilus TaxID=427918 RepID=UPI000695F4E4|nr:hypothetical protein [Nitriliruptor alkaliphilus]
MRLEDVERETALQAVGIALTRREAEELRDKLRLLLEDPENRHEHVSSDDFQTELTVWIAEQIHGRDDG